MDYPDFDFTRQFPDLYRCKNRDWQEITVPTQRFLMIDGAGNPNTSPVYAAAVKTLYSVAFPLKFHSKKELGRNYKVPPLEGLWYAKDPAVFLRGEKDAYQWTMLLALPDWIEAELVEQFRAKARQKHPDLAHDRLRVDTLTEGRCLQLLHLGPYDEEAPKLAELHTELMPQRGLRFGGHHHEIYLSDPRRAAPARLKTILRQPVAPL